MRATLVTLLAGALAMATPAWADTVIRYELINRPGHELVIEANDVGHVRADDGGGQVLILRDGEAYILLPGSDGVAGVARIEDFFGVAMEVFSQLFGEGAFAQLADVRFRSTARGTETVGAWQGIRYAIDPVEPGSGSNDSMEIVISEDPTLATASRPAAQVFGAILSALGAATGPSPPDLTRIVQEQLSRGMVLRMNTTHRLRSIGEAAVPAGRYVLPGPVLNRDQVRERLMQARPQ